MIALDVRFETTRFGEGYDQQEVDEFLDLCERALATRDGSVTARSVVHHRFTTTRFREAYDMNQVDVFLDEELTPRFAALERGEEPEPLPGGDPGRGPAGARADRPVAPRTTPPAQDRDPATGRLLGGDASGRRPGLLDRLLGRDR